MCTRQVHVCESTKYQNRVSLCPVFDVKPFYTHWYCPEEDLIASSSHFDIPNDYDIEET